LNAIFTFFLLKMSNELTDKAFWSRYWESKKNLAVAITPQYTFYKILNALVAKNNLKTAIELGGFPGYYAIYLHKYQQLKTTLFDFFVHQEILGTVLQANQLKTNDIEVIEGDLFQYHPLVQYDLVLSCGLIEHFNDTKDIISKHLHFLKPGGTLFLTLPNFRGINGIIQQQFDQANYSKHNIACMDPELLHKICEDLGLKAVKAQFYGHFSVWLENQEEKSNVAKLITKLTWVMGKVITKIIPFESKMLSPYIVVQAQKPV
jgi:2-polyprenyl-3-methyl-5-hydroxy-6-metoxy-1,4-benzoquinol methylase